MQYRTLESIQHDGKTVAPGTLIDLAESEAAPLLAAKVIEPVARRFEREIVVPGTGN